MMKAEVIFTIAHMEDGKCIDKTYDTYKFYNLYSTAHLIETIESIIKNAIIYLPKDKKLIQVDIGCNDHVAVDTIHPKRYVYFDRYTVDDIKINIGVSDIN